MLSEVMFYKLRMLTTLTTEGEYYNQITYVVREEMIKIILIYPWSLEYFGEKWGWFMGEFTV